MKLIIGLGNPGKKYERTRHNVGFVVLDTLHQSLAEYTPSAWEASSKFQAEIAGCTLGGEKIILAKPTTFMNDSGISVQAIAHFYQIPPHDIIVVHDDKDIPLGEIKVQTNRGPAGHNGVKSVIAHLGTEDFTRIRVGIRSSDEKKMSDTATFVLKKFGLFEKKTIAEATQQAVNEIHTLIQHHHSS